MAGKTAYLENAVLRLIFNGTAIANIADNASSSPATGWWLSLHTADPTDTPATEQTQSETSYTGYARLELDRNGTDWVVTGSSVSPGANVDFGECTAGVLQRLPYAGIGTASSGNGKLLFSGVISPSIVVAVGVVPRIKSTLTITES